MSGPTVTIIAYGTLMTQECNHAFCCHAVTIRPGVVTGTLYDTGCGYPAFVATGDTEIRAEAIELPAADWPAIDDLEEYPRLYDRQTIAIRLDGGAVVNAWIYTINDLPPDARIIASGDWKSYRQHQPDNQEVNNP